MPGFEREPLGSSCDLAQEVIETGTDPGVVAKMSADLLNQLREGGVGGQFLA